MRRLGLSLGAAVLAAGCVAALALAGGPPPAPAPADPPAFTVVVPGSAQSEVRRPGVRTNATIDRAVRAARARAIPLAVAAARRDAAVLGSAGSLRVGAVVAVRRDVSPYGIWDGDDGRFGPGVWCGQTYVTRRVRRPDGSTKRAGRRRFGCHPPARASVRITVTFRAEPIG